jgi:hypothetical protein
MSSPKRLFDTSWQFAARAFAQAGLLVLLPAVCAAQPSATAQREIDGLLRAVGSSGCEFLRGGSSYAPAQAQEHLQKKYEYLVSRGMLATTEEFIDKAATRSSMTGEPYAIRCGDATAQRSDEWLRARLRVLRQAQPPR